MPSIGVAISYKICDEVKTLCYQFESIVTNSTLSFKDIVFLKSTRNLQQF